MTLSTLPGAPMTIYSLVEGPSKQWCVIMKWPWWSGKSFHQSPCLLKNHVVRHGTDQGARRGAETLVETCLCRKRSERRFHGDLKLRKCGERLAGAHRGGCVGNIMVKEEKDVMHGAIAGPLLIASLLQLHYGTGVIEQEPCIGAAVPVTLRNKAERQNGWPDMWSQGCSTIAQRG